jgi:GPH family glycoside/pentoside/hexuronide:cation symporter
MLERNTEKLSSAVKLGYGIADSGAGIMIQCVSLYLLFYLTDVAGLRPELAGFAILVGKLYDALTDPLAGYLSDHTRSRLGRRRPYLLIAAIPFGFFFALLFYSPPLSTEAMFWYVLVTFLLMNTFFTIYNVPYSALSADMTTDYDERTSLSGFRMFFSMFGFLVASGLALVIVGLRPTPQEGYALMGLIFGITIALVSIVTFFATHEKAQTYREEKTLPFVRGILSAFLCIPFRLGVVIFFLLQLALSMILAAMMYFLTHAVRLEEHITFIFAAFMLTAILFLPLWVKVSNKLGKAKTWAVGIWVQAPALIALSLLPPGNPVPVYLVAILAGIGTTPQFLCSWAILPDVVEYDQHSTGERRAGVFSGLWLFTQKAATAIGIALLGGLLAWTGYEAEVEQSSLALIGIRGSIGLLPVILLLIGSIMLWRYPVNRSTHDQIKRELAG